MTLATDAPRLSYSGNGSTTAFATPVYWAKSDIKAILRSAAGAETTWVLDTDYTLTSPTTPATAGTLTATTAPASGTTLIVKSARARTQSLALASGGSFPSASVEQRLDIITRLVQQLAEDIGRTPTLLESSSYSDLTLPDPTSGQFLRWKSDLTGLENATADGDGSILTPVSVANGGTGSTTAAGARSSLGFSGAGRGMSMINGTLVPTVAASALTIAIKTFAGTDPTTTDPVIILFRNATAATSNYTVITVTAATSLVISSGSTLGTLASTAFRLWIVGFNDGGTFRMGVFNALQNGTTGVNAGLAIQNFAAWPLASSTAEGGAGGADSARTFYTGTAVTTKPLVILGYMEWTSGLATAGTWSGLPERTHLFDNNTPLPGSTVSYDMDEVVSVTTGTQVIPWDNTLPAITEGGAIFDLSLSPRSSANLWEIEAIAQVAHVAAGPAVLTLNDGTTTFAVARSADGALSPIVIRTQKRIGAITAIQGRLGVSANGTWTLNGEAGAALYGGSVLISGLYVREIMA